MTNINEDNNLELWHGGRDLEYNYDKPKKSIKGRWEHGPGLYLTTHYETAKKYARGGGKTYKVNFELGENISNVLIDLDTALKFIKENAVKNKQQKIFEDIHNNVKRMNYFNKVDAEVVLNLLFNYDAIVGEKTIKLNKFLVDNGVDYGVVNNFGGREETVFVIYNLNKINKVKAIKSQDVLISDFEIQIKKLEKNKFKI